MNANLPGRTRGSRALGFGAILLLTGSCLAACGTANSANVTSPPATTPTSNSGGAVATQAPSGPPTATIKNNLMSPATLSVSTGETVNIKNRDSIAHNLEDRVHRLYNGDVPAKGSEELTAPANPGTYVFFDPRHPTLKLTLKVS